MNIIIIINNYIIFKFFIYIIMKELIHEFISNKSNIKLKYVI